MKVSSSETSKAQTRAQAKRIAQQRKNKIFIREQELKHLDKIYDNKVAESRIKGEAKIIALEEQQNKKIIETAIQTQKRMDKFKADLKNTEKFVNAERQKLIDNQKLQIQDLGETFQDKFSTKHAEGLEFAERVEQDTSELIKEINLDSTMAVANKQTDVRSTMNQKSREHDRMLLNENVEFNKTLHKSRLDNVHKRNQQNFEHQTGLRKQKQKNEMLRKEQQKISTAQLDQKESHHKKRLEQQQESFERKFNNLKESHSSLLDRIQKKFSGEVGEIVRDNSVFKKTLQHKASDSFYTVTKINPQVTDTGKSYIIDIQIPEYDKDNVRFSGRNRSLKISVTRRFADNVKLEDGSINKSSKSEVTTKEIGVAEIVNPRTISQSYNNGTLSFQIAKL